MTWQEELSFQDRDIIQSALNVLSSSSLQSLHMASSSSSKRDLNLKSIKEDMFKYIQYIYSKAYRRYEQSILTSLSSSDEEEHQQQRGTQDSRNQISTISSSSSNQNYYLSSPIGEGMPIFQEDEEVAEDNDDEEYYDDEDEQEGDGEEENSLDDIRRYRYYS